MNINSDEFFPSFDPKDHAVGVVGHGYIGQAVESLFSGHFKVLVYDRAKDLDTLQQVVLGSTVIFVAVPTPMNQDGSCHTGIVDSVLQDIQNAAVVWGREVDEFVVVVKSTVPPGFTKQMNEKYALRVIFSPEFLTEKNSVQDFATTNRVLLGGQIEDSAVVYKFFETVWAKRIESEEVHIFACSSTTAELVKYFTNCYLSTVVTFANEFKLVCDALSIDYSEVKAFALLDRRISPSHLAVPGPDGRPGFSGSCFPKDINSLRDICRRLGTRERLFSAVIERNEELRPEKDWLELKGRAIVDER